LPLACLRNLTGKNLTLLERFAASPHNKYYLMLQPYAYTWGLEDGGDFFLLRLIALKNADESAGITIN